MLARRVAGDDRPGRHVAGDYGAGAHQRIGADAQAGENDAPEPIAAPRSTVVRCIAQSPSVLSSPLAPSARGKRSLTNITPWPTNTSSSMSTPSQTNVWLWILQRCADHRAALDLDERPDPGVVADAAAVEVRERAGRARRRRTDIVDQPVRRVVRRFKPCRSTRAQRSDDPSDLKLGDAREDRQRQQLRGQALGDRERASAVPERGIGGGEVGGLRVVAPGADAALGQERRKLAGVERCARRTGARRVGCRPGPAGSGGRRRPASASA